MNHLGKENSEQVYSLISSSQRPDIAPRFYKNASPNNPRKLSATRSPSPQTLTTTTATTTTHLPYTSRPKINPAFKRSRRNLTDTSPNSKDQKQANLLKFSHISQLSDKSLKKRSRSPADNLTLTESELRELRKLNSYELISVVRPELIMYLLGALGRNEFKRVYRLSNQNYNDFMSAVKEESIKEKLERKIKIPADSFRYVNKENQGRELGSIMNARILRSDKLHLVDYAPTEKKRRVVTGRRGLSTSNQNKALDYSPNSRNRYFAKKESIGMDSPGRRPHSRSRSQSGSTSRNRKKTDRIGLVSKSGRNLAVGFRKEKSKPQMKTVSKSGITRASIVSGVGGGLGMDKRRNGLSNTTRENSLNRSIEVDRAKLLRQSNFDRNKYGAATERVGSGLSNTRLNHSRMGASREPRRSTEDQKLSSPRLAYGNTEFEPLRPFRSKNLPYPEAAEARRRRNRSRGSRGVYGSSINRKSKRDRSRGGPNDVSPELTPDQRDVIRGRSRENSSARAEFNKRMAKIRERFGESGGAYKSRLRDQLKDKPAVVPSTGAREKRINEREVSPINYSSNISKKKSSRRLDPLLEQQVLVDDRNPYLAPYTERDVRKAPEIVNKKKTTPIHRADRISLSSRYHSSSGQKRRPVSKEREDIKVISPFNHTREKGKKLAYVNKERVKASPGITKKSSSTYELRNSPGPASPVSNTRSNKSRNHLRVSDISLRPQTISTVEVDLVTKSDIHEKRPREKVRYDLRSRDRETKKVTVFEFNEDHKPTRDSFLRNKFNKGAGGSNEFDGNDKKSSREARKSIDKKQVYCALPSSYYKAKGSRADVRVSPDGKVIEKIHKPVFNNPVKMATSSILEGGRRRSRNDISRGIEHVCAGSSQKSDSVVLRSIDKF